MCDYYPRSDMTAAHLVLGRSGKSTALICLVIPRHLNVTPYTVPTTA